MSRSWKAAGKLVAEEVLGHRGNLKLLLSQADIASSCKSVLILPEKRLLSGVSKESPPLNEQQ